MDTHYDHSRHLRHFILTSAGAALLIKTSLAPAGPLAVTAAAVPGAVLVYFLLLRALGVEERKLLTGGRF